MSFLIFAAQRSSSRNIKLLLEFLGTRECFTWPAFSAAGIEYVFCDNDTKSHMKMVKDAWARCGIELWPAGGRSAWDRAIEGYPVDRPDLNHLDQSVHASWKTRHEEVYDRWRSRKESRRTPGVFYNKVTNSWSDMPQHLIRNAIYAQRDII